MVGPASVTESLVKVQGLGKDFSPLTGTWCSPQLSFVAPTPPLPRPPFTTVWPSE
ncbi:hypothetical protein CsSME_00041270 [Camellia sinensis var. sinensis]